MIDQYPRFSEVTSGMRRSLHPLFRTLTDGISEFTFANIYLFRKEHSYRISKIPAKRVAGEAPVSELYVITGRDGDNSFFMLPFGFPEMDVLHGLFAAHDSMKAVSERQADALRGLGCDVWEDRDNFDYLYSKSELAVLQGRAFHKKKNLVNAFINNYTYVGKPLLEEYVPETLSVLDAWKEGRNTEGDYEPAKEALENTETLSLCGGIYYVDGKPAGYTLGEEIAGGTTYLIHFEKALPGYKGLYQFINMSFAGILPDKYTYINREQDLGDEGLRQAKMSYRPCSFVKKYRARLRGST